ncbi:fasciclin domain-containing protein [Pseudobacter ginsenosidimutans]|uniref:Fasciclin domain-containing protein n=1 Tax=Pseudobacter ginsenosidimutans TaxID=661488 RepID=A0A4Q7M9Q4_9BACT|nr:fasciclin domain-containing protein [Pseudobacter ginsenosidimutans]QEC42578.1 hypothetical protein FSB84_13070 [Pseudobacter ginsenosidimutans]RZS63933.1 fasciclin domain-containing protein [Pseudobacter ginsenosidimutans]
MKTYIQYGFIALMLLALITGCKKDEYIPPPEGEKIPYQDPMHQPVAEILTNTPLFRKLIEQSNMDSLLTTKMPLTILAPSDAAMQAAGYTETTIAGMAALDADTIVALHVVRNTITKDELLRVAGNLETASLLKKKGLYVRGYYYGDGQTNNISRDAFWYRQMLKGLGDKLWVNGVPSGDLNKAKPAEYGYVYVLDKVQVRPVGQSFWSYLETDPRFSMFIQLQKKVDELFDLKYRKVYEENTGWDPGGWGWVDSRRTQYTLYYDIQADPYDPNGDSYTGFNTMFAPTNDAFHAAGFQTIDDVLAMNEQLFREPVFDFNTWEISSFGYVTDSIFTYHWDYGLDNQPYTGLYGKRGPVANLFYANDLRNEYLGDFMISSYVGYFYYRMPFNFGEKDGKPTVQVKGSTAEPATVLETIPTLSGPLHVVDRLLIPKDLKMN